MDEKELYQWKGGVDAKIENINTSVSELKDGIDKITTLLFDLQKALEVQKITHVKDNEATKENIDHNKEQFELKLTPMRATLYTGGAWGIGFLSAHWDKMMRFFSGNH